MKKKYILSIYLLIDQLYDKCFIGDWNVNCCCCCFGLFLFGLLLLIILYGGNMGLFKCCCIC